jgi:hypothetical protein
LSAQERPWWESRFGQPEVQKRASLEEGRRLEALGDLRRLSGLWPRATAVLTGWALDPGAAYRYGAQVAFPVSDHADCPSLVKYVKATGAREVITHHGFKKELAQVLREEGIDARALGSKPQQLALF